MPAPYTSSGRSTEEDTEEEVLSWIEGILPKIQKISSELGWLYSEKVNLPHYRDLSLRLTRRFRDRVLAQSAFLHGIPTAKLGQVTADIPGEVRSVLEERGRLRALKLENLNVREQLLTNVLPSLHHARSIVLFVLEQLHHLDPMDSVAHWSLHFHLNPGPLDPELSNGPHYKHGAEKDNLPNFSRNVVAPTARFFGLWRERNVIEDAVLLYYHPDRLQALLSFCIQEMRPDGECSKAVTLIREALADMVGDDPRYRIRWEWRHVGSLDRQLPQSSSPDWRRFLYRSGFVAIICPEEEDCYRALYRLHSHLQYRPTELRDSIGEPTLAGYRALHTILIPPQSIGLASDAISVRLLPKRADLARARRADRHRLESIEKRLRSHGRLELQVFTPDGRSVQVPVGATVLDFAYALNHRWVAHLAGATVNRQPVDVLHHLRPSDVVWLDISETPRDLPPGWETKIPQDRARKIRKQFVAYYRPALQLAGRRWLRSKLFSMGVSEPPDDRQLDSLLQDAVETLQHFRVLPSSEELLQQLGMLAAEDRGEYVPARPRISSKLADRILQETAKVIQNARLITLHEVEIPEDLKFLVDEVVLCEFCSPSPRGHLVATIEDRVLKLHKAGTECSRGGVRVSYTRLSTRPQYLVVETTDRIGVASDIFAIFSNYQISIIELTGNRLGQGWGVVRVQIDYPGKRRLEEVMQDLKKISGVARVVGPEEPGVPVLEASLPPRRSFFTSGWSPPPPYICGSDILDDAYFYGMEEQKAVLRRVFADTASPTANVGKTVFVYGPKRAGKTSLVQCFLRELDRSMYNACITVYYEAVPGQPWSAAEQLIACELAEKAKIFASRKKVQLALTQHSVLDLTKMIQEQLDCSVVLVIDEAIGLLENSYQLGEAEAIKMFRAKIQRQPRLLVIWVGPEAPALRLQGGLRHVLQKSELLRMDSLRLEEVKALLRAEKLAPRHHIEVSDSLARMVYSLTLGNPYWASLLGREMWKLARRDSRGGIRYGAEILSKAKYQLFKLGLPFDDRFGSESEPLASLEGKILTLLARHSKEEGSEPSLDKRSILQRLGEGEGEGEGCDLDSKDLEHVLDELRARGSVSLLIDSQRAQRRWHIAAPLLAEYVLYLDLH